MPSAAGPIPPTIPAFVDFVTKLVAALRGHVRMWNTFNEPDTYACCGYLIGEFPPLKKVAADFVPRGHQQYG